MFTIRCVSLRAMANSQAASWKICELERAGGRRIGKLSSSMIRSISRFGRQLSQVSRFGIRRGEQGVRAGILNVAQWYAIAVEIP